MNALMDLDNRNAERRRAIRAHLRLLRESKDRMFHQREINVLAEAILSERYCPDEDVVIRTRPVTAEQILGLLAEVKGEIGLA